ncbi:Abi family protein [Proteinivorax tanatarense]|uniref:Abi family protein n=1 Tax=Proteinivorax tanatarense TaxID=1260629 RepID=A0AAU7VM76_9FIRM
MKPFKTYRQQLRILRSRGLTVQNGSRAMRILEKENYYALINGYKDLFLQKHENGTPITPESYKEKASIEEIYSLYCFDRDLRSIVLKELLKFESSIKSKLSYHFSKTYTESNAYLNMLSYSRDPKKLKQILQLISVITNVISKQSSKNNPIKHYLDNHDGVPLWVLVKYLTLGNIQNFYECLDDKIQNDIAKEFSHCFQREHRTKIHFTPSMLTNILKTATLFRNVCAHEERLYNFKLHKPSKYADIARSIKLREKTISTGNLFSIIAFLKLVTPKNEYKSLLKNLENLFNKYENKFISVNICEILKTMGFNTHWKINLS